MLKSGSPSSFHAEECLHVCPHLICSNKEATLGITMCIQTHKWDTGCERQRLLTDLFHSRCPASRKCFEKYGSTKILLVDRTKHVIMIQNWAPVCAEKSRSLYLLFYFNLGFMVALGPGVAQWLRHCSTSRTVPRFPVVSPDFSVTYFLPTVPWPWGWLSP